MSASGTPRRSSAPGAGGQGLKPISQKTYRKIVLWEDVKDILMTQLDTLVVLLIVAAIIFPVMWFSVGDVALLAGYAALLSLICFAGLYLMLRLVDRRLRSLGEHTKITADQRTQASGRKR